MVLHTILLLTRQLISQQVNCGMGLMFSGMSASPMFPIVLKQLNDKTVECPFEDSLQ